MLSAAVTVTLALDDLLAIQSHLEFQLNPAFIALNKSCIPSDAVLLVVFSCALQTRNNVLAYHATIALIPRLVFLRLIKES